MTLLFKMQNALVTFSLTLMLQVRVLVITKLLRNVERLEKFTCELFDHLHAQGPTFHH